MTRQFRLVLLSVVAHAVVIVLIVVASVMATGTIPTPFDRLTFEMQNTVKVADVHLPATPVKIAPRPETTVAPDAAPVQAPDAILPEPDRPVAAFADPGFAPFDGGALAGDNFSAAPPPPPPPAPAPPAPIAPVRVSSGVKQPTRIFTVQPAYPAAARAARIEGYVIVEAVIDVEGRVESARVLKSVPLLDQAALDAVRQWRFTPTILNGSPVPIVMTVTVNFSLSAP